VDGLWATESEGAGLIVRAINFRDLQRTMYVVLIHRRYRQTDGQTDDMESQYRALH